MEFGPVPLEEALGAVLAHSQPLPGGGRMRKGTRLAAEDLATLARAGLARVIVARPGPDDTGEDAAARALAEALVAGARGLRLQAVGTGRVNILAEGPGLARIAAEAVHAVNAADPAITLATVPEWQRMETGGMLATVKIIAYAVETAALGRACAAGRGALDLAAPAIARAALIETVVGKGFGEKGFRVTEARLARLGVALEPETLVAHDEAALARALEGGAREAGLILILTASATSDIRDVAPAALRRAGGRVIHFGMPVDPGNLLFLGEYRGRPVIGLPGCARSPALNGADWVLERVICGAPIGAGEIRRMGVGGLLKEIESRPRPRARQG